MEYNVRDKNDFFYKLRILIMKREVENLSVVLFRPDFFFVVRGSVVVIYY